MTKPLILLADDDALTREAMLRLLTKRGYAVACVASGGEVLDVLADVTPAAVVIDWMMPGFDGLDLLRRLRADPANAGLPVLLYTAASAPEVEREALLLGADSVILKDGGFAPLCRRIERCLSQPDGVAAN